MEISEEVSKAMHIAKAIASENSNRNFSAAHLLKGILHKDSQLFSILNSWGEDPYFMEEWAEVRLESYPKARPFSEPIGDESINLILVEAENISLKSGKNEIDSLSILASISTAGVGFNYEQLKSFPINQQTILANVQKNSGLENRKFLKVSSGGDHKKFGESLLKYCQDLIEENRSRESELFVGREQELISISEILCRKSKPNVILTGEAGVGKSAIVRGLAAHITRNSVPPNLKNARIFKLDHNALLAGVSYKGEVEDRFWGIIECLSTFEVPILFIDDIHQIFDASLGLQGVVNIIKGELAKKRFILLATTLPDEFRKNIESDTSLVRWCEVLTISEPGIEECTEIITGAISAYSDHHLVVLEEEVIKEAIKLSGRYIKEKNLPDAAIDVLDRTMAALQFMHNMAPNIADSFTKKLNDICSEKANTIALEKLRKNLMSSLNYLTLFQLDEGPETRENKLSVSVESIQKTLDCLNRLKNPAVVKVSIVHIAATISKICGIPAGKILYGERERLIQMEDHLRTKVIGQDQAVKVLADAIMESRSGLTRPDQPIGSFFLLGPTGTGKTELAKQLANFLFQSNKAFIRFDMSEFKEEHSAALLYGAPPGYVGYEEGGLLVNKIRQEPYSVVLFDEIEKAHPSVFDLFLQILDEGKIHDKLGRVGDFSNAVILFTSNIGSKDITALAENENSLPSQSELNRIMERFFRPEFLGRLSGIVPFSTIKKENVIEILKLQLNELQGLLNNQGIALEISDDAASTLAEEGYSPHYGARPLRNVIRRHLKNPISRMIITGKISMGDLVVVDLKDEKEFTITCQSQLSGGLTSGRNENETNKKEIEIKTRSARKIKSEITQI